MKQFVLQFLKYWLFWIILFAFYRAIFILAYLKLTVPQLTEAREALAAFYYALKLDLSMIGYLVSIPMLLSFIWIFFQKKWISVTLNAFTLIFITIYSLICFGEIGVYDEWRTKLNYKALLYFQHPAEIFNSISTTTFAILSLSMIVLISGWMWIYLKYYQFPRTTLQTPWYYKAAFIVLAPIFTFYFIRGGFQTIPISQSQSWYSKNQALNDAAVNSGWNIAQNIMGMSSLMKGNPFKSYPDEEAKQIVADIHTIEKDTTAIIHNKYHPNIVLIILESWAADLVGTLGDSLGITPNFDQLAKEGVLFTNLYSSGNRSQQGMASIFSGFPALPITTITEHPEKYQKLPCFTQELNKVGYRSSFYFGGQLIYGNIKSYIMYNQFAKIVEGSDFSAKIPRGKLGVHDEYLFEKNIQDLKTEPEPFFSAMFTMSSHSPYDQPITGKINGNISEKEFANSAWYTDYALGKYFEKARKQSWYKNTLFVLVADHSHVTHQKHSLQTFEYHRIPLLLCGPVIKPEYRGRRETRIASQTDLPATLLKQLGMNAAAFPWSKNLFNPYTPEFAYFEMNDGLGWKRPSGSFVLSIHENSFLEKNLNPREENNTIKEGKSYLQEVFRQFLEF